MLFKKQPNLPMFKSFGCLCYVFIVSTNRDKCMPSAQSCKKGYKVLNIQTKAIIVSRNVKFVEDIFPLHNGHTIASYGPSIPHDLDDLDLVIPIGQHVHQKEDL